MGATGGTGTAAPATDPRYRFLSRFGATLLSGGIAAIPMALYHYQAELGLAPQEVWFVGYILAHRWTDALPYPSLRRMSRRTGVSAQMLHRYKQSLIEKGFLATYPRHRPSGGRTSNCYDFSVLFQRLEAFLVRDRRDAAWEPTADESEEEGLSPRDDGPMARPVPPSQHVRTAARVTWGDVANLAGQRALTGGSRAGGRGGDHTAEAPAAVAGRTGAMPLREAQERVIVQRPPRKAPRPDRAGAGAHDGHSLHKEHGVAETLPASESPTAAAEHTAPEASVPDDPEVARWRTARESLAAAMSGAAFNAWIAPLQPLGPSPSRVADPPPPTSDSLHKDERKHETSAPFRLACASTFQRDQIERRYRRLIESALGVAVDLVVSSSSTP
jgi:hypothetical protein